MMTNAKNSYCEEIPNDFIVQMEDTIRQVRSKYTEKILGTLEKEGNLYHGDLADKLSLSASGLNAIIRKMQEPEILIKIDEIGKYKIYSLSDDMKKYYCLKNENILHLRKHSNRHGLFLPLQHFAQAAGKDWMDALNVCLTGEDTEESAEVKDAFSVLIHQAEQLSENDLQRIESVLENDVLIRVFRLYISECRSEKNTIE